MTHRKRKKPGEKKKKPAEAYILVISDGKSFFGTGVAFELYLKDEAQKKALEGRRIGEVIDGAEIGLPGYTFKLTGATDKYGFLHHPAVDGSELHEVMLSRPPGVRLSRFKKEKRGGGYGYVDLRGVTRKKTVRGSAICDKTRQINMVVLSRRGRSIREMTKESILSDRILSQLAEKIGYLVLKNGFYRVRFVTNGEIVRLIDKLSEVGVGEDFIRKVGVDLGVEIIKRGKKLVQKVIKPVLKCRGRSEFAKFVAKTMYDFYKDISAGKTFEENKAIGELVAKIIDGAEKAMAGNLKVDFSFKIKEK